MSIKFSETLRSRLLRVYAVISLFVALLAPLAQSLPVQAANYRNFVAQQPALPVAGQVVRVWVNSDTVFGETAGLEYNIGNSYTKVLGTFDTSYPGANWRIDIPASAQTKETFVRYQLFTRNQSGADYGFTGFNWNYTPTDIHWNGLKHDTFDTSYRSPFGAQPTGSTVTIRLRTEHYNVTAVALKVYQLNPDHESSTSFELSVPFESTDNTYDYWKKDFTLPSTPTIWYYKFKLLRGSDGINGGAGSITDWYSDDYADDHDNLNQGGTGSPAHSEPNQSFQLTVYNPNFQTPAWMQNAFVYQIFPDRFRNGNRANDPDSNPRTFYGNINATYHSTWNEQPEDGRVTGNYNRDFFGGDLQGIINKLDYLKSLGVTAIYMTPIVKAESNHRYDTDNYEDVDPYLGDPALFQALVAQANQRGIKLILDGVYNHTSSDSLYFDRYNRYSSPGACESTSSPFRSWYTFNNTTIPCNDSSYNGWFGYASLAVMDKAQAVVRDYIFGGSNNTLLPTNQGITQNVTQFWYNLGAAGFRFDVADDATFHHDFWQAFRAKSKTYNSNGPLIGEIWPDASPWLLGDELDAVMNYRFRKNILGFARYPYNWVDNDNNGSNTLTPLKPSEFDRALKSVREDYPPAAQYAMMNLIDSHDTNRALYVLQFTSDPNLDTAKARLRLVATFQFTYIGAPTVYYADEAGLNAPGKVDSSGVVQDDPYNRAPFPWNDTPGYYGGQDLSLTNYYAKLAYIRNQHSALRTGDFRTLLTDDTNLVYSFGRADASEKMVVALNNNTATVGSIVIPVSGYLNDGTVLTDALTGTSYTVSGGKITVSNLAAKGAVILSTQNTPAQTTIDTSISQKPNATTNNTAASFSFNATISGSTFECSLDNTAFAACTSPATINVTNGSHTFQVRAIDPLGNVDQSAASYSWVVDAIPPTSSINTAPPLLTNSKNASFSFSANESSTFQCKLDSADFTGCNSPASYTNLSDGSHTFQVKATDAVGNTELNGASYTWTVDATAPDTSLTTATPALSNSASATFNFTANENNSTFQCKLDNGAFAACSSPFSVNNLVDGTHSFSVKATDQAGNIDATPAVFSWTVDTLAPVTSLTGKPNTLANVNSASFNFNASETSTFQCSLDSVAFTSCVSGVSYSNLGEGAHIFTVKATDAAGNTEATPQTYQWTVDTVAPVVTLDTKPATLSNSKSASFTFHASETIIGFQCQLDNNNVAACDSGQAYTNLADGSHTFSLKASDAAGNTSSVVSYSWTIDTVSPATVIDTNPEALTNLTSATFNFHANKSGSSFSCSLDNGGFTTCTSPVTYSNLSEGSHSFKVRATDPAGNLDANPPSVSWVIDVTAPTVSFSDTPPALGNSKSASFTFAASEANTTFSCSLDTAGFAACTSPKIYSGLADGSHSFSVKATDAAGNTGVVQTFSWSVDTVAPTVSLIDKPNILSNSKNAVFSFQATETASTFQCKLDNDSYGPCNSGQSFSNLADGVHNFSVKATDAAGNTGVEVAYSWTVDTIAPEVVLDATPGSTSGRNVSFSFHATEARSTLNCRLDSVAFASCNNAQANYSNLADGLHSFEVTATDAAGNISLVTGYSWTVDATPPTVSFGSKPNALTNSATASFSFSANESSTFQCKLDNAAFVNCVSPYIINNLTNSAHTFAVKATDDYANTGTEISYDWTVDTVAPTTSILTSPTTLTNSTTASFSFSASKTGSTFECSLDGASFVACSSPQNYASLSEGNHSFKVRAVDTLGNTDQNPASYSWVIDTTAPTVGLTDQPAAITRSNTASFNFQANEAGSTFLCSLDSGSFAACNGTITYSGLADGVHSFSVKASDAAGNTGQPLSYSWTVDTTKPVVTVSGVTDGSKYILGNAPNPSCNASDNGAGLVASCSGTLNGGNANGVGSFTYTATATDKAGNTTTVSVSYKVIYGFSGFLPPLNNGKDASNVAKAGSTVPVKFQLKRADGTVIKALSAKWLTPVKAGTTSTPVSGSTYTDPATTGGDYNWSDSQYIYQWGTAKADAGYHWRIGVTLDDGESYYIIVDLR